MPSVVRCFFCGSCVSGYTCREDGLEFFERIVSRKRKGETSGEIRRNGKGIHIIIRYTRSEASSVVVSSKARKPRAEGFNGLLDGSTGGE